MVRVAPFLTHGVVYAMKALREAVTPNCTKQRSWSVKRYAEPIKAKFHYAS